MSVNSFDDYTMTWKPSLKQKTGVIYKQLVKQLIDSVKSGELHPGDKLPPQRELADYLDIHLSTVTRVYKRGEELGLLIARVGQGTYVSFGVNTDERLLFNDEPRQVIQMGTVLPPYNGNERLVSIVRKMVNSPGFEQLLEYQGPNGTMSQRQVAVDYLKRWGYQGDVDHLLVTTGAQNALCGLLIGLFDVGDRIAVPALTFSSIKFMAKMQGIQLVPIPQSVFQNNFDPAELSRFVRQENIKALYLVPEQNNPTAETLSNQARRNIASVLNDCDILLIEDAVNRVFCEHDVIPISSMAPKHSCYIFSTSKFMAAGLRIAYVFLPPSLKETMSAVYYSMNLMVSPVNLETVTQIFQNEDLNEIIKEKLHELKTRHMLVQKILGDCVAIGEETSCFRWLLLPNQWTGEAFEAAALKQGVQVFGPERFIVGNLEPPHAVRICISAPKTKNELKQGVEVLRHLISMQSDYGKGRTHIPQK